MLHTCTHITTNTHLSHSFQLIVNLFCFGQYTVRISLTAFQPLCQPFSIDNYRFKWWRWHFSNAVALLSMCVFTGWSISRMHCTQHTVQQFTAKEQKRAMKINVITIRAAATARATTTTEIKCIEVLTELVCLLYAFLYMRLVWFERLFWLRNSYQAKKNADFFSCWFCSAIY